MGIIREFASGTLLYTVKSVSVYVILLQRPLGVFYKNALSLSIANTITFNNKVTTISYSDARKTVAGNVIVLKRCCPLVPGINPFLISIVDAVAPQNGIAARFYCHSRKSIAKNDVQKIQIVLIKDCRDPTTTNLGLQSFTTWLAQTGEDLRFAGRAEGRAKIIKVVASLL